MFTYAAYPSIAIMTRCSKEGMMEIVNNEEGKSLFWNDDVYRDGSGHDIL